jgi:hypothetical protein
MGYSIDSRQRYEIDKKNMKQELEQLRVEI